MAQYNKYESYKFEYFEPKTVSTSNAAPKIKEQPKKAPQLKLLEKPKPTRAQVQSEARKSAMQARKIMAVACAVIMFMAMGIWNINPLMFIISILIGHGAVVIAGTKDPHLSAMIQAFGQTNKVSTNLYSEKGNKFEP